MKITGSMTTQYHRRKRMGKIKSYVQDWLDRCGDSLGYNIDTAPSIDDMDTVEENNVQVWEYHGYESEKDYYRSQPL